jgi:hypothetical protein
MRKSPSRLRAKAERCRELASAINDTIAADALRIFAEELDAEAIAMEAVFDGADGEESD